MVVLGIVLLYRIFQLLKYIFMHIICQQKNIDLLDILA